MQEFFDYLQGNKVVFYSILSICYFLNSIVTSRWIYRYMTEDNPLSPIEFRVSRSVLSSLFTPVWLPLFLIYNNILIPIGNCIKFVVTAGQPKGRYDD